MNESEINNEQTANGLNSNSAMGGANTQEGNNKDKELGEKTEKVKKKKVIIEGLKKKKTR